MSGPALAPLAGRDAIDAVALAQDLIRCASVTPVDAGAQDVLAAALEAIGFTVHRLRFGAAPDGPIDNLFATIGSGAPHFAFAGHTDVVPVGDRAAWSAPPFAATIGDGQLVGRGAADMKGAIAAFVTAAARTVARGFAGTLSLIVTGDEEGPATFGTAPLLDWMARQGHVPDACLVGEPTSQQRLGDTIKIGRRGSLNAWLTVHGAQGHDASNLEVTDIAVGNPATNIIPAQASARLNIRFNDRQRGPDLEAWLRAVVAAHSPSADVVVRISGEAFLTPPGALSTLVADAVHAVTGLTPALSTSGGTSDARFIRRLCPVVELGLIGQSMHKVDEHVAVADLAALTAIYEGVLARVFG